MFARLRTAACVMVPCLVTAQLPSNPSFSHTAIEQKTSGASLFANPLFQRLLDPPFVAKVTQHQVNGGAFSISFRLDGNVTFTHEQKDSGENESSRFAARFKEGGSYRFPQCVIDFLGIDDTAKVVRNLRSTTLASLALVKPFRAVVLDQGIGEDIYSIVIQEAGGQIHHLKGRFDQDKDARAIAMFLARGRSVEFPAVLELAVLTNEQRAERAKPKEAEIAVLNRYLGEWRGGIEGNPQAKVKMACHARPDGSGIWREITFSDGTEEVQPLPDIQIIEYDRSQQAYLAGSLAEGSPPPLRSTWDEQTRTFTTVLPSDDGSTRVNTATFTRDDRIDWKTITRGRQNEILGTTSGSYDRVVVPADAEPEPVKPTRVQDLLPGFVSLPGAPVPEPIHKTISELSACAMFRAKVIKSWSKPDELTLQLLYTSGQLETLTENSAGIEKSELAQRVSRLSMGETYEFPFAMQHPGQAPAGKPTTPEMKALEPFIGTWKTFHKRPDGTLDTQGTRARYFWSADGTCLWIEYTFANISPLTLKPDGGPENKLLRFITYDSVARCYIQTNEHSSPIANEVSATWDDVEKSYAWKQDVQNPKPIKAEGIRRFTSADRIEFTAKHWPPDSPPVESSGYYERIKE